MTYDAGRLTELLAARASAPRRSKAETTPPVMTVLSKDGEALGHDVRANMEARFGVDFGRVRVHADGQADTAAQSVQALAFTYGEHIVMAAGQYRPFERDGQTLLRHELTHVMQQRSSVATAEPSHLESEAQEQAGGTHSHIGQAGGPVIQRVGFFQKIARFFGGGTFGVTELNVYLATLKRTKAIEDNYDSDNKARDVVRRMKAGEASYRGLTVEVRVLLIKEMLSGHVSGDDEQAILDLLAEAPAGESMQLVHAVGEPVLLGAFGGGNLKKLKKMIESNELAPNEGWTSGRIVSTLRQEGELSLLVALKALKYELWTFEAAFDTWRYPDGSIKEEEVTGLQGNTVRPDGPNPGRIRLNQRLTDETAAATLVHEGWHAIAGKQVGANPAETKRLYLMQEVEARMLGELYMIKRGLPATPGYRKPDGSVNRKAIEDEIFASPHYAPTTRERTGARRYVGERLVVKFGDINVN